MPWCANVEFPSLSSAAQVLRDHRLWAKVAEAEMNEQRLEASSQGILVTKEHGKTGWGNGIIMSSLYTGPSEFKLWLLHAEPVWLWR